MEQLVDNRYRIVRRLGSGGMAEVYLAHDDVLDRNVALKVMNERYAADDEFVERFKREAQSAAALSHPNIVSIYDRGESEDRTYYIAMEYLPGGTLKDRILKRGPLPPRTAAAVALQIAEALRAAHRAEVVHRDIKPHNVLVTAAGDVKVGDFGIARAASSSTMTKTGSVLGTAHYISPEQAMGEPVGPQSDLYSLGIVLYEMLTGTLPYDAETPIGVAMKHVNGNLVPPRELNPNVPEGMDAITTRLLAKNPEERYADAAELIEDLERAINGLQPANATTRPMDRLAPAGTAQTRAASVPPMSPETRDGGKRRSERRRRRRPWVPVLLLLLLLALLGGISYAFAQGMMTPKAQVPNLVGASSIEEAQEWAGEDFNIVEGDRKESKEPVGTVLSQDPEAGIEQPKGSTISVDVSGTQIADLPDVEGETREEAEQMLEGAGFEVEAKTKESSAQEKNLVIGQDPRGGEGKTAEAGSTVTITVGGGPATAKVPNLYNLTPAAAKQALEDVGLSLGNQTEASSDQVPKGQIVDQQPAAGAEAEQGSSVDVTVSSGPRQIEVPDVVGRNVEEAMQTIWDAGFGYTVETVQSNQPAGTVASTDPVAGTLLDPYSRNVTIRQSSGPPPPPPPAKNKDDGKAKSKAKGDSKSKSSGKGKEN
ncbi:MAG: Stk1 family PASTA domain-containing Ser/Thr kinase [Actinomycetota bacterium]|nr:Stk1 family PASTA domain-containing Ser/Thr kinase [Actinomycetota bacterium]